MTLFLQRPTLISRKIASPTRPTLYHCNSSVSADFETHVASVPRDLTFRWWQRSNATREFII